MLLYSITENCMYHFQIAYYCFQGEPDESDPTNNRKGKMIHF